MTDIAKARAIALLLPVALMAGALGSQYLGGLIPCELCHWQRWPHYTAIGIAILAILLRNTPLGKPLVLLAGLAILVSGGIGVFHAGVEYGWWKGLPTCSRASNAPFDLNQMMITRAVPCDEAQWRLFGISLAGFNAIISIGGALAIFALCLKRPR